MADGVAITPGVGVTVATDDAGAAGQVQIVKLALSANGSAAPVTADADGLLVNLGVNNDVTVSGVATEATLGSILTELGQKLEAGQSVELGATTLAALETITAIISGSVAVTGTFWQATQPVSMAAVPTGGSTETTLGTRLSESDFDAKAGGLTETAPATDTASSGLNGRLQRIAQRITSLIALLPAALGAGGGLKVDGSGTALPVSGTVTANAGSGTQAVSLAALPSLVAGTNNIGDVDVLTLPALPAGTNVIGSVTQAPSTTATLTNVSASASSVTLLASNSGRLHAQLWNDSASVLYLKYGSTASATSCIAAVDPGERWEMPYRYTGIITGIWVSATGTARVTEST